MKFKFWISNASPLILLFSISLVASKSQPNSLYSEDDPLWELDSSNFNGVIFGKNNAWIVEFYNNWCGHCIRYAPTWKQFAREIKTWKKVIDVAVVNCNDAQNINLCRYYEVDSFPTIKLFWHHTAANDTGEMLEGQRDIISLENRIVDFLETNWNKGVPKEWPNIQPLDKLDDVEISDELQEAKESLMLFAEHPYNYAGRKVIMDLSLQKSLLVRRILTSNQYLMQSLKIEVSNETIPLLMRLNPKFHHVTLFKFSQDTNDTYIRDQIYHHLVGVERSKTETDDAHLEGNSKDSMTMKEAVYRIDLENAVYNSLNKEIAVTKIIEGEKLVTLKSYLSVLKNYFPGNKPVKGYLSNLHVWAANKTSITGEEFAQTLQDLQNEDEYIPSMRDWVGCKGSEPKYRGYPCSLWTLFHTLTVQADRKNVKIKEGPKGKDVLFIIRDYIKYFFTCEECSKNFQKMAENMEYEVKNSKEAALWLWKAHNNANRRLAGDLTEDPTHPKIQFPSAEICSRCRIGGQPTEEIVWDEAFVLKFLHKFYDEQNILNVDHRKAAGSLVVDQSEQGNNSAMVNNFKNTSLSEKWNFQWFTSTDISLCVSLYLVSILLIIIIFLLFRQRRRRRKIQLGRYLTLYP